MYPTNKVLCLFGSFGPFDGLALRTLSAFADKAGLPWRGRMRLERISVRLLKWEHERLLGRNSEALIGVGLSASERPVAEEQAHRSRTVLKALL